MNVTFVQFLWLIHYCLLALYAFEIARFFYYRKNHTELFRLMKERGFSLYDAAVNHPLMTTGISVALFHNIIFSLAIDAISLPLLVFSSTAMIMGMMNEVSADLIKKAKQNEILRREDSGGIKSQSGFDVPPQDE